MAMSKYVFLNSLWSFLRSCPASPLRLRSKSLVQVSEDVTGTGNLTTAHSHNDLFAIGQ